MLPLPYSIPARASASPLMNVTPDAILALAPDQQVASAGQKLAKPGLWQNLGRSAEAVWGECRGSAVYRVQVNLTSLAFRCSCPSRKHPCKHAVGLMLLTATDEASVPTMAAPAWVEEWLEQRRSRPAGKQEGPAGRKTAKPKTAGSQQSKRARERLERVMQGAETLDLWMADIVRRGLAQLETQPASFWERQAARLVDAQAPGLAGRVRRMARIPGSTPDWPACLLADLGELALLTHALRRIDALDPDLRHDVQRLVGWTFRAPEVAALGESVTDEWVALGRYIDDTEAIWVARTWLAGVRSGRHALVLQFSPGRWPSFPAIATPGTRREMELVFWPGAYPQRARIETSITEPLALVESFPGRQTIGGFLGDVAQALSAVPWMDLFPCILDSVVPIPRDEGAWLLRDIEGAALPLQPGPHWLLMALSGGHPIDVAAEWDGSYLRPLAVVAEGAYHGVPA